MILQVRSSDVLPTVAELAGAEVPAGLDGISFAKAIQGQPGQRQHEFLYWEFYERNSRQAVRMNDWKAVIHPIGGNEIELFNLKTDRGEQHDVAAQHPEIAEQMLAIARREHVESPDWPVPENVRAGQNEKCQSLTPRDSDFCWMPDGSLYKHDFNPGRRHTAGPLSFWLAS